jgi:hypothetical protein
MNEKNSVAQPSAAPGGYKLVPVEPTQAMFDAARTSATGSSTEKILMASYWRNMVAAAPTSDQPAQPSAAPVAQAEPEHFYTFTRPKGWVSLTGQSWEEWTRSQGIPTTQGWKVYGCAAPTTAAPATTSTPQAPTSDQQAGAVDHGISVVYAWLQRASHCGLPEVEDGARTMMAYYQGAEFPEPGAPAAIEQAGAQPVALIVATEVNSESIAVAVHLKHGDCTTVVYSRNHALNGGTIGTELLLVSLVAAPTPATDQDALEPVEGDLLPPVGSKVLIHLASQDAWVEHTVTGYYVWPALKHQVYEGQKDAHRVFVRVKDANGYGNARLLSGVRLAATPVTDQPKQGDA